jgi:TetR/AcrR family transcriptional regulator, cholesterol catabolism regulator
MPEERDTRQMILRAAEELFMRYGYASVTMRRLVEEIAKQRRLTKPAIYYYFTDKEALYVAVLLDVAARNGHQLRAAAAVEGDLRSRLVVLAEVLARLDPEALTRMRLDIAQHLGAEAQAELRRAFQRDIFGPVLAIFEQAAQGGRLRAGMSPALTSAAFLGLVSSLVARVGGEGRGRAAELAVDVLLTGVASP